MSITISLLKYIGYMPKKYTKKKKEYFVDKIIFGVAIIEPLCTLPQIYEIISSKDASNISIATWIGFNALTAIWIWYAVTHKEKMVLIYQSLFFILDTILVIYAIAYGATWF